MAIAKCRNCGNEEEYIRDYQTAIPAEEWTPIQMRCECTDDGTTTHDVIPKEDADGDW